MEARRVLFNFRYIIIMVLLLGFLFVDFYDEVNKKIEEERIIEEVNSKFPIQEQNQPKKDANSEYKKEIDRILKRVDILYNEADSDFERSKLKKTRADFVKLKSVQVSECEPDVLRNVTTNKVAPLVLVVLGIVLVSMFFEERKRGLWSFVYSTVRGRKSLALRRCSIIVITMGILTIVVYSGLFLINWKLEGVPDFNQSIQSYIEYQQLTKCISVKEFLVYFIGIKVISAICITMIVWLIMSIIGNVGTGLLFSIVLFGIEFALYKLIDPNGVLSVLRNFNLFYFIEIGDWLEYYVLYGVEFFVVERRTLLLALAWIVAIGSGIGSVILNATTQPYNYVGIYQQIIEKDSVGRMIERLPVFLTEFRKILCWTGGIWGLIVVVLWSGGKFDLAEEPYKNTKTQLSSYYKLCEGKSLEWVEEYINELNAEIEKLEEGSYIRYSMSSSVDKLEKRFSYVKKQSDKGREVKMLDDMSYKVYFGQEAKLERNVNMLVAVMSMIVIFSHIYSLESRSNTITTFSSMKDGKVKLKQDKITFIVFVTVIIYSVIFGSQIYMHWYDYGFLYSDLSVYNATTLADVKFDCSLGEYIALTEGGRLLLMLLVGFIISLISKYQSAEKTMMISILIFVLPILLSIVEKV